MCLAALVTHANLELLRCLDDTGNATFHDARRIQPGAFVVLTITNDGKPLLMFADPPKVASAHN